VKSDDLEIFIENTILNVKRGAFDVKEATDFIIKKFDEYIKELNDKLDQIL
jgi:hypothetical protein